MCPDSKENVQMLEGSKIKIKIKILNNITFKSSISWPEDVDALPSICEALSSIPSTAESKSKINKSLS